AGTGDVIELRVRKGDVIDTIDDNPGSGEYLYRPGADKEPRFTKSQLIDLYNRATEPSEASRQVPIPRAKTKFDTPAVIKAREASVAIPKTDLIDTPERAVLRNEVIKKIYGTGAIN